MPWSKQSDAMARDLMDKVREAPQVFNHCPGRGDPEPTDAYEMTVTAEQRDMIVRALDFLTAFNSR